jgi:hypothetical protein
VGARHTRSPCRIPSGRVVFNMQSAMPFVPYLRHAFAWAGPTGYAEVHDEPPPMIAAIVAEPLPP